LPEGEEWREERGEGTEKQRRQAALKESRDPGGRVRGLRADSPLPL